jgi:hypothetical protein
MGFFYEVGNLRSGSPPPQTKVESVNPTVESWIRCVALATLCGLTACAGFGGRSSPEPATESSQADESETPALQQPDISWTSAIRGPGESIVWHSRIFPGKNPTRYVRMAFDGRDAIQGDSVSSASMLRQHIRVEPFTLGNISFAWQVAHLIPGANMGLRDHDDSPVRIMLAFEGDRSRLSLKDNMLSELARTLTGEEMPYATLMYVWCNSRAPGSVITSPRTDRIRSIVLESGPHRLNQWLDYQRDIRADFETAFGEAPGALVGVAIMSDSDNTRSEAKAWYGAVRITPTVLVQAAKP